MSSESASSSEDLGRPVHAESPEPERGAKEPRTNRWLIPPRSVIAFTAFLVTFVASALTAILQAAPSDIYHPGVGLDLNQARAWVEPIEFNTTSRSGISSDLHALYVMPDGKRMWAGGVGRTIWRSDDGGRRWQLQYPSARDAGDSRTAATFVDLLPLPSANAAAEAVPRAAAASDAAAGFPSYLSKGQDPTQTAPPPSAGAVPPANPAAQTARPPAQTARPPAQTVPAPAAEKSNRRIAVPQRASGVPIATGTLSAALPASSALNAAASQPPAASAVPVQPPAVAPADASPDDSWLSIRFDAMGNTGWAVGSAGGILATVDGGETWRPQHAADDWRVALRSVAFLTPDDVWIVGDDGVVLRSRNRGRRWDTVPSEGHKFMSAFVGRPTSGNPWGLWFLGTSLTMASPRLDQNLGFAGWNVADMADVSMNTADDVGEASTWLFNFRRNRPKDSRIGDALKVEMALDQRAIDLRSRLDPYAANFLQSLVLSDSGAPEWALGSGSLLLKRTPVGWTYASTDPNPNVRTIARTPSALWAAGEGGLYSMDTSPGVYGLPVDLRLLDGRQWVRQSSPSAPAAAIAGLRAMQFIDAKRGWAVGRGGAIVATDDGAHWHWLSPVAASAQGTYRFFPSPVALLGLATSLAGLLWLARRARLGAVREPDGPVKYETGLDSDQPLRDLKKDKLGHATTVMALSAFIRNSDTEPRLTIAITAPWGRGKSTVMRMLQSDLERYGYLTAWFNAWHHQQEGRPLSALFGAIGSQALPSRLVPNLWMRYRLIWRRGVAYRILVVASVAIAAIVAADAANGVHRMREDGTSALDALEWRVAATLLDRPRVVLTDHALQTLNPCSGAAKSAPAASTGSVASPPAPCMPCPPDAPAEQGAASTGLRPKAYCYARSHLLWQSADGDFNSCEDVRTGSSKRCVFRSPDDLVSAIENGIDSELSPNERRLVVAAGETLTPPPLLPFTEKILPAIAIVLGLFLTKGVSVYGIELLKPLRLLVSPESRAGTEGKEASGVIEKYRTQFGNLASALRGRLVIFIDDLDRCSKETVNSVLEMSNYLTDVGECFLIIGADLEIIKLSLKAPDDDAATPVNAAAARDAYASRYLRKLIHVELPVPATSEALARTLIGVPEATRQRPEGLRLPTALDALRGQIPRVLWTVLTVIVVYSAVSGVMRYRDSELQTAGVSAADWTARPASAAASVVAQTGASSGVPSPAATRQGAAPQASTASAPTPRVQGIGPVLAGLSWFLACAAALAGVWLLRPGQAAKRLGLLRARVVLAAGGSVQTHDPKDMQDALDLWHEVVYLADGTPRGSRRYRNKSRLFGMLLTMQFKNHEELRASVHAAALVALNFVSPSTLASLAARGAEGRDGQGGALGGTSTVDSLVADSMVRDRLIEHQKRFGEIPAAVVAAFQNWAATVQVR